MANVLFIIVSLWYDSTGGVENMLATGQNKPTREVKPQAKADKKRKVEYH